MIKCIYLCAREHRLDDIEGVDFWFTNMLVPLPPCKPVPQHKAELSYGHRDNNQNVDIYIRNWVSYVKGVI